MTYALDYPLLGAPGAVISPHAVEIKKPWGTSQRSLMDGFCQVESPFCFLAGGYSSIHRHRAKYNIIYILEGKLEIKFFSLKDGAPVEHAHTMLRPRQEPLVIAPGKIHQFVAQSDGWGIEVYLATAPGDLSEDIERFSENGRST